LGTPEPVRSARLERRLFAAILAGGLALMLIAFHWGLPNVHSWNGDDIAPDKPLRVIHDWWRGHHKYPYLHWWLNLPLYLPWVGVVALRGEVDLGCLPRLRPSCFANPWRDMTVFIAISRAVSVAMGVGIVLLTRRLALALHGERSSALLAAAIAAGSPVLIFFSHTSNLDVPATFWLTASLVAGVDLWRRGATIDYALFALLAACAITTKDAMLGAWVLPGLALLGVHVARVGRETGASGRVLLARALLDRRLRVLVGVLVGVYVGVQNVLLNFPGFIEHWRWWIMGGPLYDELHSQSTGIVRFLFRFLLSAEGLLGAAMLAVCLLGLAYAALAARSTLALLLPLASYFVVSLLPSLVEPRLVLPLLPIFAVWGGLFASRLLRAGGILRYAGAALVALAFAHEYGAALHLDLRMLSDSRYEAEDWISEHVPRSARITALSAPGFLPRVDRMGYDVRWHAISEIQRGVLEADGAEWAILTSGGHPFSDRNYLDALRAGRLGYEVAYRAEGRIHLLRWLDSSRAPGAVSPPIFVLHKRDDPRPGAANR
jgi:hypothetical protein